MATGYYANAARDPSLLALQPGGGRRPIARPGDELDSGPFFLTSTCLVEGASDCLPRQFPIRSGFAQC